jgi:hypothetical protein
MWKGIVTWCDTGSEQLMTLMSEERVAPAQLLFLQETEEDATADEKRVGRAPRSAER